MNFIKKLKFMDQALLLAKRAYLISEVPIGALVVDSSLKIIGEGFNQKEKLSDSLAHAEILAIREASNRVSNWRLAGCVLFTTLEPCPMCISAMVQARISELVFGAYDYKGGALSLNYNIYKDLRVNHNFRVTGGVNSRESKTMLQQFFKDLREG